MDKKLNVCLTVFVGDKLFIEDAVFEYIVKKVRECINKNYSNIKDFYNFDVKIDFTPIDFNILKKIIKINIKGNLIKELYEAQEEVEERLKVGL